MNGPHKLAAILAADVVSYSPLTGLDEEGMCQHLHDIRSEVIE